MRWRKSAAGWLLVLPAGVYYLFALAIPLVVIVTYSLDQPTLGFGNFTTVLEHWLYIRLLLNTLEISVIVTAVTAVLSYPYAYAMSRVRGRAALTLGIFVLLPFLSSSVVRSFTWGIILQPNGVVPELLRDIGITHPPQLIGNSTSVVIGMTQIELPFLIFPIYAAFLSVSKGYLDAAASLGASSVRRFLRVTLPLTAPGAVVGALLVFISTAGYYVTPQVLGGTSGAMIGQIIAFQINSTLNYGIACALGVILLVATVILIAAVLTLNRRRGLASL
jgi:putative spermidine/putrescine transport system permease protein